MLLLEQTDFAWGTSSRSSKMVHGGLRYIAQGDIRLTRHSLLERERLIEELPGLVERATYLFPLRKGSSRTVADEGDSLVVRFSCRHP